MKKLGHSVQKVDSPNEVAQNNCDAFVTGKMLYMRVGFTWKIRHTRK